MVRRRRINYQTMRIELTELPGVHIIRPDRFEDERGYFARTFCMREFAAAGLNSNVAQCNVSCSHQRGTLRGMHFQLPPAAETKLVRCTRGAIFDVALDVRPGSRTFGRWVGAELSAGNAAMLYVPKGFAHGFQTLTDDAEVFYQMSEFYTPELGRGVRWNDPAFAITWPLPVSVIAPRDRDYPDVDRAQLASLAVFLEQE
jgi:dTDP-4-dehydrorhamnose 3,5-epimerase